MKIDEAIEVLKKSNKWRRGAKIKMPDPKITGEAIDFAIKTMRKFRNATKNMKNEQKHIQSD